MGFKYFDDSIGTFSANNTTAFLTSSYLTIGGQQYATGALQRTISADVTLTANTLYMVYAVVVSGAVQLRVSTSFNSTGPSGFSAWKLVGAFFSRYDNSVFYKAYRIDVPLDFDITVVGGTVGTNVSVLSYYAWSTNSDSDAGVIQTESGGFTASTGTFAVRQPGIYMPTQGLFTADWGLGWTTATANFSNTWHSQFYKNGSGLGVTARNWSGSSVAASLNFMKFNGAARFGVSKGDLIEFKASQDLANALPSYFDYLKINFKSYVPLKEM